jgi:hypothetical protein
VFLSFWIEYIENLCNTIGKHPWIIFVAYIFQVNRCQSIVVHAHTIRVFDPLTLKDMYLQSCAVIEFSYVMYVPIVRGFYSQWIKILDTNATIFGNTPPIFFFCVISVSINVICLP